MTAADYGRWVQAMMGGVDGWLKPDTLAGLTTPLGDQTYARGWITHPQDWAENTTTIAHEGSNTLWHAVVVASPRRGLGFYVLSNGGFNGRMTAVPLIQRLIAERAG